MLTSLLHPDLDRPWIGSETRRDLVAHAARISALLVNRGQGRVVLSCKHARSFIAGLLGAWSAGATVELLPNVQPGTLDRVDADADVAAVLHDVATTQERSPKAIYLPDVLASLDARFAVGSTRWPEVAVAMTTSGTTERPKLVTTRMDQLAAELEVLARVFPTATCVLSTVPLSHLYGLLFGALLPLKTGARIVDHEALLPADVAAVIEREHADLMVSTPAHLRAMAGAKMPRGLRVISSGARLPLELHGRLAGEHDWQVADVLGSTETGGIAMRTNPMATWTPLPNVQISAPNGQLCVSSPWCGGGRIELDDRVELKADGSFQHLGRNTELVKIAGKRAHAQAIEATVLAIPGVTDVASVLHAAVGKEPRLALAVSATAAVDRSVIAAAISAQFDPVFVPKIVKLVPRIPRTERGKVATTELRQLLGLDTTKTTAVVPIARVAPGEYTADIPSDLVFFQGHFDQFSILPGAVLVERVVWPAVKAELPAIKMVKAIRRLRFRRPVYPDQQLIVKVKRPSPGRVTFEVACAAQPVASGQLVVDEVEVEGA
jgi:acyl-coenzyme A synthetase/AMP-(fatty) acid ligase